MKLPFGLEIRRSHKRGRRSYDVGVTGRLWRDWVFGTATANEDIKPALQMARDKARDLEQNNVWIRRYLAMCEANVVGRGAQLQLRIEDAPGKLDTRAIQVIEAGWRDWCRNYAGVVPGQTFQDQERLTIRATPRDGECLWVPIRGAANPYGYALQQLEPDQLDHGYNVARNERGNRVVMGVEIDGYGRPLYYHILTSHPGDLLSGVPSDRATLPYSDLYHIFRIERAGQVRGMPWISCVMHQLKQLHGLHEAELVAARASACKMGFFKIPPGEDYNPDEQEAEGYVTDARPGTFEKLPYGWDFIEYDPKHPTTNFGPFTLQIQRAVASGLNVSYNSLANDLTSVNYSSLRQGALDERENWISVQEWLIAAFHRRVFADWLKMALTTGVLNLPIAKYDKFRADQWQGRRWGWVDPTADVEANVTAVQNGWKTNAAVIAEYGGNPDEVWQTLGSEQPKLAKAGVNSQPPAAKPTNTGATPNA